MITTYLNLFIKVVPREIITSMSENITSLVSCKHVDPQTVYILLTKTHHTSQEYQKLHSA